MNSLIISICTVMLVTMPPSTTKTVKDNLSEIERDAKALELYLQDKKDYKEHCPHIQWTQPSLNAYKRTLNSHLPKGCKE